LRSKLYIASVWDRCARL